MQNSRQVRRSARRTATGVQALRTQIRGRIMRPPPDPPQFIAAPWYSITLSDQPVTGETGRKNYRIADILAVFRNQTGIQQDSILFRVHWVQAWNTNNSGSISLGANDLSDASGLCRISQTEDTPTRLNYARVGFEWPLSQQNMAFLGTSNQPVLSIGTTSNHHLEVRFRVLWKTSDFSFPNDTLQDRLTALEERFEAMNR